MSVGFFKDMEMEMGFWQNLISGKWDQTPVQDPRGPQQS